MGAVAKSFIYCMRKGFLINEEMRKYEKNVDFFFISVAVPLSRVE